MWRCINSFRAHCCTWRAIYCRSAGKIRPQVITYTAQFVGIHVMLSEDSMHAYPVLGASEIPASGHTSAPVSLHAPARPALLNSRESQRRLEPQRDPEQRTRDRAWPHTSEAGCVMRWRLAVDPSCHCFVASSSSWESPRRCLHIAKHLGCGMCV